MKYCPQCSSKLSQRLIDGRHYDACPNEECVFINYDNPTPVVAAIIEVDGYVLLVHNVGWPPKMYGLVSGFLEKGESPGTAIQREIKEETNLDTDTVNLVGIYAFEQMNQVIIAYHATCKGKIELNEELDEYKKIDVDKLVPWSFGTGLAVKDWLDSR